MESIDAVLPQRLQQQLPDGACDTHNHVFGPFETYPLEFPPDHPVPLATINTYQQMLDIVGLDRGVLVQPTQYDCRSDIMLRALSQSNDRLRGVAAARPDISDDELQKMSQAGVSGLRFVQAPLPNGAPRPGAVGFEQIADLSSRMRDLNWSISVWGRAATLMENIDKLLAPGLPVVFEHMGMVNADEGLQGEHFQTMLALLREGRIWVKLSVCRCSKLAPDYADLQALTVALLEANPDQVLWGSDWPFIRMMGAEPDVSSLLKLLVTWINDPVITQKVLVDNPARLYQFSALS